MGVAVLRCQMGLRASKVPSPARVGDPPPASASLSLRCCSPLKPLAAGAAEDDKGTALLLPPQPLLLLLLEAMTRGLLVGSGWGRLL